MKVCFIVPGFARVLAFILALHVLRLFLGEQLSVSVFQGQIAVF